MGPACWTRQSKLLGSHFLLPFIHIVAPVIGNAGVIPASDKGVESGNARDNQDPVAIIDSTSGFAFSIPAFSSFATLRSVQRLTEVPNGFQNQFNAACGRTLNVSSETQPETCFPTARFDSEMTVAVTDDERRFSAATASRQQERTNQDEKRNADQLFANRRVPDCHPRRRAIRRALC